MLMLMLSRNSWFGDWRIEVGGTREANKKGTEGCPFLLGSALASKIDYSREYGRGEHENQPFQIVPCQKAGEMQHQYGNCNHVE